MAGLQDSSRNLQYDQYAHGPFYRDGSKELTAAARPRSALDPRMAHSVRWTSYNQLMYTYRGKTTTNSTCCSAQETSYNNSGVLLGESAETSRSLTSAATTSAWAYAQQVISRRSRRLLISFFARANYGYKGRYCSRRRSVPDGSTCSATITSGASSGVLKPRGISKEFP